MRMLAAWKRAVTRVEEGLVGFGCAFVALDVVTVSSAWFAPVLTPLLAVARLCGLAVLVPAVLRSLAIAHADREDSELLKAIAIAVGLAALYVALRTWVVVKLGSL